MFQRKRLLNMEACVTLIYREIQALNTTKTQCEERQTTQQTSCLFAIFKQEANSKN